MEQTATQSLFEDLKFHLEGLQRAYSRAQQKFMQRWGDSPSDAIHWNSEYVVEAEYQYRVAQRIESYRDILLERAEENEDLARELGSEPEVAALFMSARENMKQVERDLISNRFRASSTSGFSNQVEHTQRAAASSLIDSFSSINTVVKRYDDVMKNYELADERMEKMLARDIKQADKTMKASLSAIHEAYNKKGAAEIRSQANLSFNQAVGRLTEARDMADRLGIRERVEELAKEMR